MNDKTIEIPLNNDEALVLFELLSRFSETGQLSIQHQSEERTLWNLANALEAIMSEPFKSNYDELLKAAQERVEDKD